MVYFPAENLWFSASTNQKAEGSNPPGRAKEKALISQRDSRLSFFAYKGNFGPFGDYFGDYSPGLFRMTALVVTFLLLVVLFRCFETDVKNQHTKEWSISVQL